MISNQKDGQMGEMKTGSIEQHAHRISSMNIRLIPRSILAAFLSIYVNLRMTVAQYEHIAAYSATVHGERFMAGISTIRKHMLPYLIKKNCA